VKPLEEMTEDEFMQWILPRVAELLKAAVALVLAAMSALIVGGSPRKALAIGAVCAAAALFSAWRRILEPVLLLAFLAAAVWWCVRV